MCPREAGPRVTGTLRSACLTLLNRGRNVTILIKYPLSQGRSHLPNCTWVLCGITPAGLLVLTKPACGSSKSLGLRKTKPLCLMGFHIGFTTKLMSCWLQSTGTSYVFQNTSVWNPGLYVISGLLKDSRVYEIAVLYHPLSFSSLPRVSCPGPRESEKQSVFLTPYPGGGRRWVVGTHTYVPSPRSVPCHTVSHRGRGQSLGKGEPV